ncbi:PAP2-domain-containing protein [Aureobasidium pullulans]|uniref:PAP2-domain-containing protein n=1 Tax=Aureobasidium pullulans TaxID=5580 RepID=A0A4T0BRF7_AURPU|nr:PAP2-domain-containing protein [Aureobasidium pullulans]THZ22176.1 PAP2-domain-containing protein [Aureobasidium pullulans]TIA37316.1 PAP2-domain-containing protein [Aureobasidium pullulans]
MSSKYFALGGADDEDSTQRFFTRNKFLPSLPTMLPHRLRRKFRSTRSKIRSRQTPTSSISSLQTSFNPRDTLQTLRDHQWSVYDAQYIFLAVVGIFALCVIQSPGPMVKTTVATLLMLSLLLPVTRQFFLPFLPIAAWLVFFFSCQFISGEYRPPIWVRVLPALENILYGANLSNILSAHKAVVLDVLAWLPYGITHFGAPFVCSGLMFLFGPPGTTPTFARAFGYMNLTGVMIQLFFPCSPPWYENMYGLAPANYSMQGSPAGLAAIDKLFGIDLYTSTFTASPMVFGAFPSLHSGCATIEALFMSHTFPKLRPLFIIYTGWLWWSTMYLSHHYAVDLVGGSLLSAGAYYIAKGKFLPRLQPGKMFRWDYDYVEVGEAREGYAYGITDLAEDDFHPANFGMDSGDEWTIGSSSSVASSSRSPSVGARSPVDESWEGDTLASTSDNEYYQQKPGQKS